MDASSSMGVLFLSTQCAAFEMIEFRMMCCYSATIQKKKQGGDVMRIRCKELRR